MKILALLTLVLLLGCQTLPYKNIEGEKWNIRYKDKDYLQAILVDKLLIENYYAIPEILNVKFDKNIEVKIYPDIEELSTVANSYKIGKPRNTNSGFAMGQTTILVCSTTSHNSYNVAIHEYVHLVIKSFAGSPVYLSWIDESICYYLSKQIPKSIKYVKEKAKENNYFKTFEQDDYYIQALYYIGEYLFENYSDKDITTLLKYRSVKRALNVEEKIFFSSWCTWIENKEVPT
ncbi:MAG: hypothetical protein WAZ31_07835 [Rectinemataceae bacterium]